MSHAEVRPAAVHSAFVRVCREFLPVLSNRILSTASEKCNVDKGSLRASLHVEGRETGFRVGSNLPYARAVHEGSRPHVIAARNVRYLRFPGRSGQTVFARSVNHPGYRGNPFLRDAMVEEIARL